MKIYALKGRSDGIAYQRYEKDRPNAQWHIDLKHTTLSEGTKVYICIIIDDYSSGYAPSAPLRQARAAVADTAATTESVTQVTREAILRCGPPRKMVSVNEKERS